MDERVSVERLARSRTAETRLVERAQIILAAADGARPSQIAERVDVTRTMVYSWIKCFNAGGIDEWHDRPRSGRPATYPADAVATAWAAICPAVKLATASWNKHKHPFHWGRRRRHRPRRTSHIALTPRVEALVG